MINVMFVQAIFSIYSHKLSVSAHILLVYGYIVDTDSELERWLVYHHNIILCITYLNSMHINNYLLKLNKIIEQN